VQPRRRDRRRRRQHRRGVAISRDRTGMEDAEMEPMGQWYVGLTAYDVWRWSSHDI
jgi:hypothetical protein